jgi:hypothetical protein
VKSYFDNRALAVFSMCATPGVNTRPVWAGAFNASPTFRPSRAVRTRGGRGGYAVHGWKTRMVEAGLVRLEERVVEAGRGLLGRGQLGRPK